MRSMLMFLSLVSVAHACPDLTGSFAGWCRQQNTCHGDRDVYVAIQIRQTECSSVRWTDTGPTGLSTTQYFTIGRESIESYGPQNSIRTTLTYEGQALVRQDNYYDWKGQTMAYRTDLEKVTANDASVLHIRISGGYGQCQSTLDCQIPDASAAVSHDDRRRINSFINAQSSFCLSKN